MKKKVIIGYFVWLLIALLLATGVVAIEAEFFLKKQDFITGFFVNTFGSLKRLLIIYLGGFIGILSFLIFILIQFSMKRKKEEGEKIYALSYLYVILFLVIILKVIHSVLAFKLHWI